MHNYEIELRGILTPYRKKQLLNFLKSKGQIVRKYKRTQWVYSKSWEKKLDLRIKKTNNQYEFSLKTGNPGNSNRKEISIPFKELDKKQAFDFLKLLGYDKGMKAQRNAQVFNYRNIEWAIVDVPGHSTYFEAEKIVKNTKQGIKAKKEIKKICNRLNLEVLNSKQTMEYINKLDNEINQKFKI